MDNPLFVIKLSEKIKTLPDILFRTGKGFSTVYGLREAIYSS